MGEMEDVDYRESFANRLRSLRTTAGLSIEDASGHGGLSTNFWGNVERNEQEPCLNTIFGLAKGLGITASVLIALDPDEQNRRNEDRRELDTLIDLLTPGQLRLAIQMCKLIYAYKPNFPGASPPLPITDKQP